jgi:phosphopantetheinyl transferase (holo-ACP synthase)
MDKGGTKHTGVPVKTLKKLLKKAGLKVSGKKATLTRRAKKARLMKGGLFGVPDLGIRKRITDLPNLGIRKRITDALPDHGVLGNAKIITQDEADENSDYATTKNFSEDQPKSKLAKVFAQKKGLFKGSPEQIAAEAEREKNRFVTKDIIDSFKKVEGNQQKLKEAFKKEYGYELDLSSTDEKDYIIYKSHNVWEGSLEQRGARAERRNKSIETNVMIDNFFKEKGADEKIKGAFKEKYGSELDDPEMMKDYVIYYLNPDVANYEFPWWYQSPEQEAARDERLSNRGREIFANDYFDLMKQGKANAIPQSFLEKYGYDIYRYNFDSVIKDYITHYFTVVVRKMDGGKKKTRRS